MKLLNRFALAWIFLGRLPWPGKIHYSEQELSKSAAFFPWVGGFWGLFIGAGAYVLHITGLPVSVCIPLLVGFSLLLTGAFHEDGFADTCDAIGGGVDKTSKLQIMKDSRLGTYGVLGLLVLILIQASLWWELYNIALLPFILSLMLSQSFSRFFPLLLQFSLPYVSDEVRGKDGKLAKSKPMSKGVSLADIGLAFLGLLMWSSLAATSAYFFDLAVHVNKVAWGLGIMIALGLVLWVFWISFLKRHLGGYTGDTLGASVKTAEIGCLICLWYLFVI